MTADPDFNIFNPQPLLIVISGPSGVGKDSVVQAMKDRGLPFHFVVNVATRPKRPNEVDGQDYFFVSIDKFKEMIDNDQLLEYAIVYNDYKGVPKDQIRQALMSRKDVIMRVDVQGAITIQKIVPDAILIFLSVQSERELIKKLKSRNTETQEDVKIRLVAAQHEYEYIKYFDYVVVNKESELDKTVDIIGSIIEAEHHRIKQRMIEL